jgi:protein phosphatase
MQARIQAAGRTDVGRKRESNQDQYLIADLNKCMSINSTSLNLEPRSRLYGGNKGSLMMVADGMGGHQAGRRASSMAIDIIINNFLNSMHWSMQAASLDDTRFMQDLKKLIRDAHDQIERDSKKSAEHKGMGTTLTMAYILWPSLYITHVGDTRCYLVRDNEIRLLTRDHTMANQMAEQSGFRSRPDERSPWSNVLWNALGGGGKDVVPDTFKIQLLPHDILLLCSDGLNKHVNDEEIRNILELESDPTHACRALIDLANYRGGVDNITAIVARIGEPLRGTSKTLVAAQVTLERMIDDLDGYVPDSHTDPGTATDIGATKPYVVESDTDPDDLEKSPAL